METEDGWDSGGAHPMTAENKNLVERLRDGADLYGSDQFATTLHEAANLIERLEREKEEAVEAMKAMNRAISTRPRCAKCHGTGMEQLSGHDRWATCEACNGKGY